MCSSRLPGSLSSWLGQQSCDCYHLHLMTCTQWAAKNLHVVNKVACLQQLLRAPQFSWRDPPKQRIAMKAAESKGLAGSVQTVISSVPAGCGGRFLCKEWAGECHCGTPHPPH